ncbi:hypothetical protein ABD76_03780 [Paenibacillus dendritiformis]|nr:hypothetical protein [Paenibacillus dendritiformis]
MKSCDGVQVIKKNCIFAVFFIAHRQKLRWGCLVELKTTDGGSPFRRCTGQVRAEDDNRKKRAEPVVRGRRKLADSECPGCGGSGRGSFVSEGILM